MTEAELVEHLADKEHASWARWMKYLFSVCGGLPVGAGLYRDITIPAALVMRWDRQADTPYAELSEPEKQSDRDEVAHILPIIREYHAAQPITFTWYPQCPTCKLNHAPSINCWPAPGGGAILNMNLNGE